MPLIHEFEVDKKSFAARIFELRERCGLSQIEIVRRSAKRFGQSHFSQWLSGTNVPNALQIPALAEALGVDLWELYEDPSDEAVKAWNAYKRQLDKKRREREQADD